MAVDMSRASKRSKSASYTAASLPEEIIYEILLVLPSRCILRFRAVCRSWAALLSSPSFTDAYAAKADARARQADKFVLFAPSTALPNSSTVAYSCARGADIADPLFRLDRVAVDFICLSSRPCHGAMLFSDTHSGTYWVCNPSTGERTPLPRQHRGLTESSAGLVYDDRTKQHKVVHLFFKDTALRCEVYTLCDPSREWRPAKQHIELSVGAEKMIKLVKALQTEDSVTKAPPVFANGWLHWLVYPNSTDILDEPAGRDALLCFSVATETFILINAPASVHVAEYRELDENLPAVPIHLAELEGSVCLVHDLRHRGQGRSWLDVWMLKDHAASEWLLDYRIDVTPLLAGGVHFSPRFITVLGCCCSSSGNNQDKKKILIATSQHQVHAYDPDTGYIQLVLSVPEYCGMLKEAAAALWLGLYEDSLVRIGAESYQEKQMLLALTNILVRLPIKSITRSMLACRKWCSLVESESFVTTHTTTHMSANRILMVNNGCAQRAFFDFAPVKNWLQQAAGTALAGALVDDKMICSKPCHGLNLISTINDDFLCNPCTGAIRCLGRLGRSHFTPTGHQRRHAFSVGRTIGFGFDQLTGEHVAVEIGHISGNLACMIKRSREKMWSCIGKPPTPVSDDMPPAHVKGTLYWMSETRQERVIVAFEISTQSFHILACLNDDRDAFLVELNGMLSLVAMNTSTQDMDIFMMMDKRRGSSSWVHTYKIRLDEQPDYSLKTGQVVMPVDIDDDDGEDGKILLNTGRALGYYDTRTGALDSLYSMDHLKLPRSRLAFPILCQESLVRIQEDELPNRVAPPARHQGSRRCDHPEHADATLGRGQPVLPKCEGGACVDIGVFYRNCCRRLLCMTCQVRCLVHSPTHIIRRDPILPASDFDVTMVGLHSTLPFWHPSVPGPEFCYYYTTKDGDVVRHVFISLSDYVRGKRFSHQIECGYRMEGKSVKESWVRRYLKL